MRRAIYQLVSQLVAIMACATVGVLALGQIPGVRRALFDWGMQQWEERGGIHLEAEELSGFFPFQLVGHNVRYVENGKTFLIAPKVSVTFSPWELLRKRIAFKTLHISDPVLLQRRGDDTLPDYDRSPSSWSVELQQIEATNLTFGDELLESIESDSLRQRISSVAPLDLVATASFILEERRWEAEATLLSEQNPTSYSQLKITGHKRTPEDHLRQYGWQLDVRAVLKEEQGGLTGRLLGIADSPPLGFDLGLDGAMETWGQLFSSDVEATAPPLKGHLGVVAAWTPSRDLIHCLVGDQLAISSRVELAGDRSTRLDSLQAKWGSLSGHGELGWAGDYSFTTSALALSWNGAELPERCPLPPVQQLTGQLALSGSFTEPSLQLHLDEQKLEVDGWQIERFRGSVAASFLKEGAKGLLQFTATHREEPLAGFASFLWEDYEDLDLSNVSLSLPGLTLDGSLRLLTPSMIAKGHLSGECSSLFHCLPSHSDAMVEQIAFSADVHPSIDPGSKEVTQSFAIDVDLRGYRDEMRSIGKAHLSARGQGWPNPAEATIHLVAEDYRQHNLLIEESLLSTTIDTNEERWPFSLRIRSGEQEGLQLATSGFWFSSDGQLLLRANEFTGQWLGQQYQQKQPFTFSSQGDKWALSDVAINISGANENGSLSIGAHGEGAEIDGRLSFSNVRLDPLAELYPELPVTGRTSGSAVIGSIGSHLVGELQLTVDRLQITDAPSSNPASTLASTLNATLSPTETTLRVDGRSGNRQIAELELILPLTISSDEWDYRLDGSAPLQGRFFLDTPVEPILQFATDDTNRLTGILQGTLQFSGTAKQPLLHGELSLNDGSYESLATGVRFTDIFMRFRGDGNRLLLADCFASDGNRGRISAGGVVHLDQEGLFPFEVSLLAENTVALRGDHALVEVDGALNYAGNLSQTLLSGDLTVTQGSLTIPQRLPRHIPPKLAVTYVGDTSLPLGPVAPQPERKFPPPIDLMINVAIPGTVTLEGRGLRARWDGKVEVAGSLSDPKIRGALNMRDSQFEFANRQLEIKQGALAFEGRPSDTAISVQGELQLADIRVLVLLHGPVRNPRLELYSTPELPQREIVSLILFNKPSAELTPFQGLQLAQTANNLSGRRAAFDVVGDVRRSVGLDRLELGETETADGREYSVLAGKYLSRGVYVGVSKALNADRSSLSLEADLNPMVKIEGEISSDASGKLSLKWKRDY